MASQFNITFLCLLVFLFKQQMCMLFLKKWIYFDYSVTGIVHLAIFCRHINIDIHIFAALESSVAFFQQLLSPSFLLLMLH